MTYEGRFKESQTNTMNFKKLRVVKAEPYNAIGEVVVEIVGVVEEAFPSYSTLILVIMQLYCTLPTLSITSSRDRTPSWETGDKRRRGHKLLSSTTARFMRNVSRSPRLKSWTSYC